ncbi:RNA-binding protein 48, partial [Taenia solium]
CNRRAATCGLRSCAGCCLCFVSGTEPDRMCAQVFTIADESPYLLIFGVPSIGLLKPLEERIQKIEDVQQIRKVSHPESEEFTETYIVKFRSVNLARNVKRRLDDSSFYGGFLHIVYAPEYESVAECRVKMHSYRRLNDAEADKATRTLKLKERQRSSLNTEKTGVDLEVTDELSTSACTSLQAKRVFTPLPTMSKEDAVLLSNPYTIPLHITSPSQSKQQRGDALDDARNYWASRGLDFLSNSKRHPIQSAHPSPIPLPTEASTDRPFGIPLATQQALLRQPTSESAPQEHSALKWSYLPQSVSSTTVPASKDLTEFIPRSVAKANRLLTGILPPLKERK